MKKRVCILTSVHPIDDVRVYHKIALSLSQTFEVTWIGTETFYFENELGNDNIHRILIPEKKGIGGRLAVNRLVLKKFLKQKDVAYVYIPDPELAFFYSFIKIRRKAKAIFDIHEVFHKDLLNRKIKGKIYPIVSNIVLKLIRRVVRRFDLTIGVNNNVLDFYVSPVRPFMIVRSCLPQSFAKPSGEIRKKSVFTIVHGKNHPARGTKQVLDALVILKKKNIECKVLMIEQQGLDNDAFKDKVKQLGLENYIELHHGLPFAEMQSQMAACHAGLIAYGKDLGIDSLPNRFFEYMATGIPVIVPTFSVEMVAIVNQERCGLLTDTENPEKIAESFELLINTPLEAREMAERGRSAFLQRHNWEHEVAPLIHFMELN